jgi:hypothetical protein
MPDGRSRAAAMANLAGVGSGAGPIESKRYPGPPTKRDREAGTAVRKATKEAGAVAVRCGHWGLFVMFSIGTIDGK